MTKELNLEYWLYTLNHLADSQQIPELLKDDTIIKKAFDVAEFLALDKDEQFSYQQDLKARLDYKAVMDYAKEEAKKEGLKRGIEQGIEQGKLKEKLEIAKNLLLAKMSIELIATTTNLSVEEIEQIKLECL